MRDSTESVRWGLLCVLLLQLFSTVIGLLVMGPFFTASDEYCRLDYALAWSRAPFFAPHDHIWLGGNFWILGSLVWMGLQPVAAGILHGAAGGVFAALAGYALLRTLGVSVWLSVAGCALFSSRPIVMALAKSPQPDMLFLALLFASLACAARHFACEHRTVLSRWAWLGAIAAAASQTLRFEGWMLGAVLGVAVLAAVYTCLYNRRYSAAASWIGCGIVLGVFPLAWMASSWSTLGSPLAFLANIRPTLGHDTEELFMRGPVMRAVFYPFYTLFHIPVLAPLGLLGVWSLCRSGSRGARASMAILTVFWFIILFQSIVSGTGNNWPYRYAVPFIAPLALLSAPGALALWRLVPGGKAGVFLLVLLAVCEMYYTTARLGRSGIILDEPRQPFADLGRTAARLAPSDGRHPRHLVVDIRTSPAHLADYDRWVAAVHAGRRYEVWQTENDERWNYAIGNPDFRMFLTQENLSHEPGMTDLAESHGFTLWVRDGQ